MGVRQMVSMFLVLLAVAPTTAAPSSTITAATTPASTTTTTPTTTIPPSTTTTTPTTTMPPSTTTTTTATATTTTTTTTATPAPLNITVVLVYEDRYIITCKVLETDMEILENELEDLLNVKFTDKYEDKFSHSFVEFSLSTSTRAEGTLVLEFNSDSTPANLPSNEAIVQTVVDALRDPNNALNIEPNSVTLSNTTAAPPTTGIPASTTTTPAPLKITVILIFEDHVILACRVIDTDMEILGDALEDLFNVKFTDKYEDKFSHSVVELSPSNSTHAEGTLALEFNSHSTPANLPSKEAIVQTVVDALRDPENALNIEPNSVTLSNTTAASPVTTTVPTTAPPTTAA